MTLSFAFIRMWIGEFVCSLIFYTSLFCVCANAQTHNWTNYFTTLATSFVGGFQAIAVSFAFSNISGAQFNSAISLALWLTGKLSNRRLYFYIFVQLLASLLAMVIVTCIFDGGKSINYSININFTMMH